MNMKNNSILIFICLLCFFSCTSFKTTSGKITSKEMIELMNYDSMQLIDVRSQEEFLKGHLQGAQNIIFDEEFKQKISQLDKSKPVAVYCRTGRRSKESSKILEEAGFKNIYQLKDGLSQWKYEDKIVKDTLK